MVVEEAVTPSAMKLVDAPAPMPLQSPKVPVVVPAVVPKGTAPGNAYAKVTVSLLDPAGRDTAVTV